jgi:hypothetical protein
MAFAYVSDWPVVIEIATEVLETKTKDLQIRGLASRGSGEARRPGKAS